VRRLRSADGVYFTKYGARKLAHYVEREIRRYMSNRSLVSLPSGPMGPVPADGKSAVRPLAGPVVPLTVVPGASEELLGGAGQASARGDAIATQVLVKGEPVAAPSGRADDFAWRQGGAATAPAAAPAAAAPAPAAAMSAVTPVSAPAPSAYTEPEVVRKKPDPKAAPAVKTAEKKKPENRPRPVQTAPRPPQPVQQQPSGPFGLFLR
jgi:outer membrane biosynthesis protein TonB